MALDIIEALGKLDWTVGTRITTGWEIVSSMTVAVARPINEMALAAELKKADVMTTILNHRLDLCKYLRMKHWFGIGLQ